MENYYDLQKEIEELKNESKMLKRSVNMVQLKKQLNELNSMYKNVNVCVDSVEENVDFLGKETEQICQVLDHDNKVHMGRESAKNMKGILSTVGGLVSHLKLEEIRPDNLNEINENFAKTISSRVDKYKANSNLKKRLIANVEKLTETNVGIETKNLSTVNCNNTVQQQCLRSNSTSSIISFSETHLVTSSPLPN